MTLRGSRLGVVIAAVVLVVTGCGAEPFEPNGPQATEARARAWGEVDLALADVQGDREPIGQARFDGCHTGQNNWKIKDEYQHDCSVARSVMVPAAELDEVSQALQTFNGRFEELGCTTTWRTLAQIDEDYWTKFKTRPDYRPGSLPEAHYQCGDRRITVAPTDTIKIKKGLYPTALMGMDDMLDQQVFPEDLAKRAKSDGSAMFWMITAYSRYYSTKF